MNGVINMKKPLLPYLKLIAIAEDEATEEFFAIIKCRDLDGGMRPVTLPLADLDNRKALAKTLTNFGVYFANEEGKNKRALDKLLASKGKAKRMNFAARVGWYGGYKAYVLANQVIGAADSNVEIRPPRLKSGGHAAGIRRRGEHAEWLRTVAAHAKFSSRMVFAISAALAAPLLGMAKLPSFGILVHGPGKAGKSTMLLAAASVTGYGREQDLPNFRATDAAFGEIPAAFNDSMLPLNELGLLKGSAAEKRHRLRDFTYGFAEGRGTTYSKLAPMEGRSCGSKWLSISLATGEETADEIARDAREIRMAGESVRWIDLAATRNGAADIFDRIPKKVPGGERAQWVEQRCAKIRAGCRRNHGVSIQHFIERVIRNRKVVQKKVRSLRQKFVNRVIDTNDDPVVRHLAKCFGHIYAAAVIGVGFGTLPWSTKTVRKCIERCYRDARREMNTETDLLRDGLSILHAKIRALPKANGADLKSVDGFLAGTKPNQATIRAEAFKAWFPDVRQPNLVLTFLREKNALLARRTPKPGVAIVWAESQLKWPNGSRPRSIVIDERPGQLKI
jgi:putative DNA primase/helicase